MGYQVSKEAADRIFAQLRQNYDIFAPKVFAGEGCFSDTDVIRYGKVDSLDEIEWERRSDYSFKEALLAVNETLFYFTEDETTVRLHREEDLDLPAKLRPARGKEIGYHLPGERPGGLLL